MKERFLKILENQEMSFEERIEKIERLLMVDVLEKNKWVKLKAARALKVTYRIFNYKYDKYRLDEINPKKSKKTPAEPAV